MNYFLYGSEPYNLINRRNDLLKEKQVDQMNISIYRGNDDINISEVLDDCSTVPFFADYKVVILENPGFVIDSKASDEKETDKLLKYLDKPIDSTILIIYCDAAFDRRKKIVKELSKRMKVEIYDALNQNDFQNFVRADLVKNQLRLDNRALTLLLERLPLSLQNWKKELEKLCLYPGKIDEEVINSLISKPLEDNIFELSDAVISKNLSKALHVYNDLLTMNKSDVQSMIGLLAYQFRFMCQCKILSEMGNNYYEIANQLGVNDYRVKMTLKSAGYKSSEYFLRILNKLATLDLNIKTGNVDGKTGLELFIIETIRG